MEERCLLLTFFDRCRRWRSPLAAIVFADEFSADSSSIFVSAVAAIVEEKEEANVEDVDEEEEAVVEFESVSDDDAEEEVAEGD